MKARYFLLAATLLASGVGIAAAQTAVTYDLSQLPALQGKVAEYSLTPRGDIDGLIMADGTEVHLPPHLSTQIAFAVKPGDSVTVHGLKARAIPMMQGVTVTNDTTNVTVSIDQGGFGPRGPRVMREHGEERGGGRWADRGDDRMGGGDHGWDRGDRNDQGDRGDERHGRMGEPMRGPGGPGGPDGRPSLTANGAVKMALHGPRGEVNGVLLQDGTIVRMPPPEAQRLGDTLKPGATIFVQGFGSAGPLGKVIAAMAVGTSADKLTPIMGPHHGPHGDPDMPPPPPPGAPRP